jgi:hypothetical protein
LVASAEFPQPMKLAIKQATSRQDMNRRKLNSWKVVKREAASERGRQQQ